MWRHCCLASAILLLYLAKSTCHEVEHQSKRALISTKPQQTRGESQHTTGAPPRLTTHQADTRLLLVHATPTSSTRQTQRRGTSHRLFPWTQHTTDHSQLSSRKSSSSNKHNSLKHSNPCIRRKRGTMWCHKTLFGSNTLSCTQT